MKDGGSNPLGVGVERMLSTMSCHRLHDVSCAGHFGLQVNCYPLRTSLFYSTLERMWVFYYPTFFFFLENEDETAFETLITILNENILGG